MAGVPQITNPLQGKGYSSTTLNNQQRPGGEQFEIIQLTKPQAPKESTDRESGNRGLMTDRKDLLPMTVKTPKDPTMAVETLKQLINSELLATAKANGYTELYGELEKLSKSIYLSVDELVKELLNQEKQTTMFSNHQLFAMLRELAGRAVASDNLELQNAIGNFLKAVNFSMNRDEILNALSANLRFLSGYFSPSQSLAEKLSSLADAWGGGNASGNFEILKGETLSLLHNVSESLLNNEKTQILIPLIIHNLSRYNTNDYMLKDYFSALLVHIPSNVRNGFVSAFDAFFASLGLDKGGSPNNNTTNSEINQALFYKFPSLFGEKLNQSGNTALSGMTQNDLSTGLMSFLLGKSSGMEAITTILSNLFNSGDTAMQSALRSDLAQANSISTLVDYLNNILSLLPDVPERQTLFEMLSETIAGMAEKGELPPEAAAQNKSSLEELTAFIEKNINHAALKTLNSFNASNLLQSLINAPGVFTPLAHYIIPLQFGGTRAFGELWVDNDEKNAAAGADGKKNIHLFLTFEVETVGRFETDLYASGAEINLAVLYPEGFEGEMKAIKEKINRIIADTGYHVKEFRTGVLREPHDLTQIFPRILEKREGLDVVV
ncbi:MAG: hypothetical protein FWD34_08490 [Oscillospiraceae bacterium]|nr:hypothetical protein [Oscillospiraceae bacterium]